MDDTYDDGLVHNHHWAAEPPPRAHGIESQGQAVGAAMSGHPADVESFDDGLVHGHDWARN